jgi:hypothetical protein
VTGSIRRAISAFLAPKARLRLNSAFFKNVVQELHRRGDERREAGAFLLGSIDDRGRRTVDDVIFYDDVYPDCARSGAIALPGELFATVWEICRQRDRAVVADVHTPPGLALQSETDQRHPVVAMSGHIAMIVPNYAKVKRRDSLGVFEYRGAGNWRDIAEAELADYLEIGWWV